MIKGFIGITIILFLTGLSAAAEKAQKTGEGTKATPGFEAGLFVFGIVVSLTLVRKRK